jgi:integrase
MISKIMAYDLERYKNMRRDEVSPATVNREISCIKHMFTKAQHWNLVMKNPLHSVAKFKEPPGRVRYLSEDEIDRLLYCCSEHLKAIVITALNTGMRKKEILDLQWPDVDLIKRIIRVRNSKNHQARIIPINDVLYALLLKLPRNRKSNDNVFLGKHGMPVRSFQNAWDRALRNAGIADFRFHDLRHTFASHLAMRGVNIRDLQELLGHKTILMTMRYSHLSDDILRQAVDRLNLCERNVTEVAQVGTNLAQGPFRKVRVSAKPCKH